MANERNWPQYGNMIQTHGKDSDLILGDARFRVTSFLETLAYAKPGARIAIHDFFSRPYYHLVLKYADLIECVNQLAIFTIKANANASLMPLIMNIFKPR